MTSQLQDDINALKASILVLQGDNAQLRRDLRSMPDGADKTLIRQQIVAQTNEITEIQAQITSKEARIASKEAMQNQAAAGINRLSSCVASTSVDNDVIQL